MKLKINLDIGAEQADNVHGEALKDMIVIHETVSANVMNSLADVKAVSHFLDVEDYGIHGITDNDGNTAWARGFWRAIFYHTASLGTAGNGHVNTRAIGIEQVSRVMLDATDNAKRWKIWMGMRPELDATAKLIAAICNSHPSIPLISSSGRSPGITTHWEVTMQFRVSGGHTDAWPHHLGGYYPKLYLIQRAKYFKALGYRL